MQITQGDFTIVACPEKDMPLGKTLMANGALVNVPEEFQGAKNIGLAFDLVGVHLVRGKEYRGKFGDDQIIVSGTARPVLVDLLRRSDDAGLFCVGSTVAVPVVANEILALKKERHL